MVFVKTDYLSHFFQMLHPQIFHPYILLTHNSDIAIPGAFDPQIIAWFGQNVEYPPHPKLIPIPNGIANSYWDHGNPSYYNAVRNQSLSLRQGHLLYMNFNPATHLKERSYVYDLFREKTYCKASPSNLNMYAYLTELSFSTFALNPRGNGLDCHRTWEALYMGAIPIVHTSTIDSLFEGLPVWIVQNWTDVSKALLQKKQRKFSEIKFSMDKIYIVIDSYRNINLGLHR